MKTKTLNENYSGVCHYCGEIFRSNKSTALFCPDSGHRQLYGKYGPRIHPLVITRFNEYQNADDCLYAAYRSSMNLRGKSSRDGWGFGFEEADFVDRFGYLGPYPEGAVLLVAGSYVLKGRATFQHGRIAYRILVKPITLLTVEERAIELFVSAKKAEN